MTSSSSRPAVRRLVAVLTAVAVLVGLGALVPSSALADVLPSGYSISGTVTDDTGAPVAGVAVQVSPNGGFGTWPTTDALGHYSATGYQPGSYTVTFVPPAGSGLLYETYDNSFSWNSTPVVVGTADVTGIDAALDRAASISGRVVDPDGNPIPGVSVTLQSVAFVYANATSGADGSYSATGLRPGDWRISFSAPYGSSWVSELYDDARTADTQTTVPLAPGTSVTLHDAVLARGGTITGRILAPDGTPKSGVEVFAYSEVGGSAGATTGPDGTYALTGLGDGDFQVNAQSDWGANLLGVVYPGTTNWLDAEPVHLAGAATVDLGDMSMVPGATITGTLYGPDGAPLAGASVQAVWGQQGNGAPTASDGSFSINLLPAATYVLVASGFGPAAIATTYYSTTPAATRPSLALPVTVAAGDSVSGLEIHAAPAGTATGTVVATAAHAPVLGEPFTVDVTVTGDQGVPTGSVWVGSTLAGDVAYADADLDASGHATLTFDAIDQGTYPWVDVTYPGDATYHSGGAVVDYVPGAAPPSITTLAPATGTVLGGEQVALTGTGLGPDSTVTFGGTPATVAVTGPTTLVATAPAHAAGQVDVVVTTQGQASAPVAYAYTKVPTSLALTGPTGSTVAGTAAAFTATVGPASAGSVAFVVDGGTPVAVPLTGGAATLSTSALSAGTHTVIATFAGDATYGGSTARVTHTVTAPPTGTLPVVQHATPDVGPATGGTLTVLTGKNFVKGRTTVSFGSVTTTKVTVLSSTKLVVVVPRHGASVVHVTATTPAGRSTVWARFTFVAPSLLHPASSPFAPLSPAFGGATPAW